jgi:CO dehydrogenase/acetyl-CoA synthase gamma subunit (corrinoid Fe-S protein)
LATADLYLDKIDFMKYLPEGCREDCGYSSCKEFLDTLQKDNHALHKCPFIRRNQTYAFEAVGMIKDLWPQVPLLTHPRPGPTGLVELNQPDEKAIVLITGNNKFTQDVLLTVLGTTLCPFYVVFTDTDGNTIDMAMIYKTFTAERISSAIQISGIGQKLFTKLMIIPGLAAQLQEDIRKETRWTVRVGPECAAELPLYFSEIWIPP